MHDASEEDAPAKPAANPQRVQNGETIDVQATEKTDTAAR
jgi:hypothetical protein